MRPWFLPKWLRADLGADDALLIGQLCRDPSVAAKLLEPPPTEEEVQALDAKIAAGLVEREFVTKHWAFSEWHRRNRASS